MGVTEVRRRNGDRSGSLKGSVITGTTGSRLKAEKLYPVEPLRRWLWQLHERACVEYDRRGVPAVQRARSSHWDFDEGPLPPMKQVCFLTGLSSRTLYRLLRTDQRWVSEHLIDCALSTEGSLHIGDLYPEYWEQAA